LVEAGNNMSEEEDKLMLERYQGWNKVLYDKCANNEIQDVFVMNQPECLDDRDSPPPH
jgi:hypothetical protein